MNRRLTIGLCAVVIGMSSLSLCQPPTPRIAQAKVPACVAVVPGDTREKDVFAAFKSRTERVTKEKNQDGPPDGLLSEAVPSQDS